MKVCRAVIIAEIDCWCSNLEAKLEGGWKLEVKFEEEQLHSAFRYSMKLRFLVFTDLNNFLVQCRWRCFSWSNHKKLVLTS